MIKAKKSLGQNFLIDNNIIDKILNIVEIKNKNILEIGPGTGNLTSKILDKAPKQVTVIEKDKNLANLISEMTYDEELPVPFGVFYKKDKLTYEDMMIDQIKDSIKLKGEPDLQALINGQETWEVK